MRKEFQAKQITDAQILLAVRALQTGMKVDSVDRWSIRNVFPQVPPKVVDAKLRAAVLKGIITGCGASRCAHGQGCRGDFKFVPKEEKQCIPPTK